MNLIDSLKTKGFSDIKFEHPGSIQLCANHTSGVAIWFYSKHNAALLSIFSNYWDYRLADSDIHQIWDYMTGEEIDSFELSIADDAGGLLSDEEVLELFTKLWNKYLRNIQTT